MVNAQKWLDEEYPIQRRSEITELDISKGKVKRWPNHERTLKGDLKLEGFTNLQNLNCSGHELTSLDLGECRFLTELDCQNNKLNILNINGCHYLDRVDCSSNNLRDLDPSNCTKLKEINCGSNNYLEEVNISSCSELTKIGFGFTYNNEKNKLVQVSQVILAQDDDIRNILIVGMTGNGKSTLANVLTDTNQFRAEGFSTSITEIFKKSEIFEWQGKKYCVIDNIGFGDTSDLSKEDLLYRIGQGIYSARQGINQILFVFKGRFSDKQIIAFNLFKDFVSESGITKFTTIIRTKFENFKEPQECIRDWQNMLTQNRELNEIINSCKSIIHVNNPPIPIIEEDDDEEMKEELEQEIIANEVDRKDSRKIVLDYLAGNCQEIYKLKNWDCVYKRVSSYMEQIGEEEKKLLESNDDEEKNRLKSQIEDKKEKIAKEVNAELTAEISFLPKLIARVEVKDINMPWKKGNK
ncbi:GTPase [endosymbiont GvMRE of Glomus versiforme]|uniref:GTPase n=1 Tax=endosymbiont GvMRE of Glomus versiforme TaxID=2039283 RepID=UPI000EE7A811|nr:GTPase [endosymbiont GvMRE of Glomus versiforme]RHZ35956.1 immune-associated nucleotide-binding protein 8-like [endosymbiont GvMRE of Glomus versiforme]